MRRQRVNYVRVSRIIPRARRTIQFVSAGHYYFWNHIPRISRHHWTLEGSIVLSGFTLACFFASCSTPLIYSFFRRDFSTQASNSKISIHFTIMEASMAANTRFYTRNDLLPTPACSPLLLPIFLAGVCTNNTASGLDRDADFSIIFKDENELCSYPAISLDRLLTTTLEQQP